MKRSLASVVAAFLMAAPVAHATYHDDANSAKPALGAMAEGEVRRVDKEQRKLTVKHGEIKNLEMPPMTMVFRVKDASLLDHVKAGDKIRFSAEKVEGNFTITQIEAGGHD
jgi:Cu(I)/Ag(I) efflux system periplasmic protein CusF